MTITKCHLIVISVVVVVCYPLLWSSSGWWLVAPSHSEYVPQLKSIRVGMVQHHALETTNQVTNHQPSSIISNYNHH